jgi:hypothetical protein
MVEATRSYHPKVLRAIDALARYYAREEAKRQIRARGQRVTDYAPRDISIMAKALFVTKPEHFVERAKASAVVKEVVAKIAAQAARKAQRKTVNTLRQCVDSRSASSEVSQ